MIPTHNRSPRPTSVNAWQKHAPWLYAFWKFSRPHTIIGTSLSVIGLSLMTLGARAGSTLIEHPTTVLLPLLACLCGNVYIVGLNQLEDIEIDRINKPHLPLASGEFSRHQGQLIVAVAGALALALAATQGQYLLGMVSLSLLIGTAYSLPPVRLKRFPFWASLCIFTVRGAIVNLGLFLHFSSGLPIPLTVWALTIFVIVFTFAIAIFKDIPDIEGDRHYNISTLTIRLGPKAVFNLALWVLTISYLGMIAISPWLTTINTPLLVISHLGLWGVMAWRSRSVNLRDQAAIAQFYQFIWKLFFLEYLLFPVICLWH
jgi:homogentisate phytyltransferase / homogentisate geranylgeranyltransferase